MLPEELRGKLLTPESPVVESIRLLHNRVIYHFIWAIVDR